MTRVLVTGAAGFIGTHFLRLLDEHPYEVHAVSRRKQASSRIRWHQTDLLRRGSAASLVSTVRPQLLVHLAWTTAPGTYLTSPDNALWLDTTKELVDAFVSEGGNRFVGLGTVLEYDVSHEVCDEVGTPARPASLYGQAKLEAGAFVLDAGERTGQPFCWARLFHPYGPGEPRDKLVSSIAWSLREGREALLTSGHQIRDYVFVSDVAHAMIAILEADTSGVVNIGSGNGVSIREIAFTTAELMGRSDLLRFGARTTPPDTPMKVVASTARLRSTGWAPRVDLSGGIKRTVESIRQ